MPGKRGEQLDLALREVFEGRDPLLQQELGVRVAAALHDRHRLREPLRELAHLRLALDVDPPAGELDRQPHVLALAPDRERELVVRDDHVHRLRAFVDDHLGDLRRRERRAHVARRIGAPRHDVDALAAQLLDHGLHAAALHAHAGAHRVDVAVPRDDGDLRAPARLARSGLDRDDALVHLGHLLLEELGQHLHAGPRQDDLRALRGLVDVDHVGADAVVRAVGLARHLLAQRQDGLGASEVDDDRALLEAPDDAVDDLALAILVLLEDVVALGLADPLDDHLLGRLREDAPEARGVDLHADLVAELGLGIEAVRLLERDLGGRVGDGFDHLAEFEELDLSEILVVAGLDLALLALRAPCGLLHGLLDRADDLLAVDSLVLGDLVDLAFQAEHARTFIWGSREERSRHA